MRLLRAALLILAVAGSATADAREPEALHAFAVQMQLRDVDGFVETVTTLRSEKHLPARYLDKAKATTLGWRGGDLCRTAPGKAIGGDIFANRERRLPEAAGRRWREADLDYACGTRGAKRLLWSSDDLIFVTVDHYQSFHRVPDGAPK
ncbi:MAG: ribonuclease N [Proteobacteria bacterium]|nr:ribonuclease N [Pseudomonadota bacterium]